MAFSYIEYTANGSTTTFSIPFAYTAQADVAVFVNGVSTSFTFASSSTITLSTAPASGVVVRIARTTPITTRAVDFSNGAILTESDLDNSNIQVFQAAQEAIDTAASSIFKTADGKFDAQSRVIKNVADPVSAQDAVTKTWAETASTSQLSQATAQAVISTTKASESSASATASEASKAASAASATAGAASAATATTQAALATTNGAAQVALATTQAGLATTNGAAQVTLATAQKTIATTKASEASASATASEASKVSSASSATSATASAATATTQAALATTNGAAQVALATTQAGLATTNGAAQVALATAQVTLATAQKTIATTKASESAASATASANSAAAAAASFDSFDDRYLGAKSSEPSVNNDGDALVTGNLYFLTGTGMQVYDGANWIAASSSGNVSLYSYEYIATAGQTSFSGADVNGQTLSYTANNIHVTYGGLDIPKADYVATNGTTVVLDDGAIVGTIVRIVAFQSFVVANTYTQAQADARYKSISASEGGPSLGLNSIIRTNAQVINEDITIPANTNGSTIGDITVNAGKTVTVSSGSTWVII
jgi:hypothetical protein